MIIWTYAFIDRPAERLDDAARFWTTVTGTVLSARRGERGEFATLLPPSGDACVKLQGTYDDAGGAHLDLVASDVPALLGAAVDLGATVVVDHSGWAVLRSPAGQAFCVNPWSGESSRPPVAMGPGGAASRLDQVCIDIAPEAYDAEVAFWARLTGWELRISRRPEFRVLRPGGGLPLRILLQRLDTAPAARGPAATAHLDLACSDRESTRAWHETYGASLVDRHLGWLVMRDPAGGIYCLTARDPATGDSPALPDRP